MFCCQWEKKLDQSPHQTLFKTPRHFPKPAQVTTQHLCKPANSSSTTRFLICFFFLWLFREDHEANPQTDRPQREGSGWPFNPGWPQGGGGAVQPEMWSCSLNKHISLFLSCVMQQWRWRQSQTSSIGSECLCALFKTEWRGWDQKITLLTLKHLNCCCMWERK